MKVRAIQSAVLGLEDGSMVNVTEGQAHDSNAPVVKAHPWCFERDNAETPARNR